MRSEATRGARNAANGGESAQRGETQGRLVGHQVLEVHGGFARAAHGAPSARCTDCQGLPLRASECSALPTTATLSALGIPCGRFQACRVGEVDPVQLQADRSFGVFQR